MFFPGFRGEQMILRGLKLTFLAVSLVILMVSVSYADDGSATAPSVDLTDVGMGARPIALGGAYTGLADDASAVFTNPAGLARQNNISFVSMSTQILNTVDYKLIGFTCPTQYGQFGVGYIGATTPAGYHTYYVGGVTTEGGAMNYTNQMFILSYGKEVSGNVGVGANVKFLSQGLDGSISNAPSASGMSLDLGAMYEPTSRLTIGATLQNIAGSVNWSTGENETLPKLFKLGCAYKALENVTVALDTDFDLDGGRDMVAHGGAEWQVIPFLSLRAGIDQQAASISEGTTGTTTDYVLGVGLNLGGFRFDYAYRQDPNFSELSTNYFSICYTGGSDEPVKQASEVM
jgi:hypothetical protein